MKRAVLFAVIALLLAPDARSEPYLAVQKGMKCVACHTSPSGGGKRNSYGNYFAQRELPARTLGAATGGANFWDGELFKYLAIGGDIRGGWNRIEVPGQATTSDTEWEEFIGYAEVKLIPNTLSVHLDAQLAPDDPFIREQYLRLSLADGRFYLKGGEFFLPFGLRLQDDSAFIRQVGGINFNTPDTGWELGWEQDRWSVQFAVSRGTAGGPETDSGKQYSLVVSHVRDRWRVGGSVNFNDTAFGDRQMQNVFAGLRTGRVSWLGELDFIIDEGTSTGRRELWAGLLEANVQLTRGHNIKISYEHFDPDDDVAEDEQNRFSLLWEYFPIQFVQTRLGYRIYDGIPQNPAQNRDQYFAELHLPF
ncbi:MAG: hypothetical protein OEW68_16835 [Gammaproteobacteria bacterium]|nr:hypothetical protein [Gammaproteobacteria bacterium]MDH4316484.1 hypothetical protein [Gammaproteobacteria bacterium]MDH5214001.1 hypothetical protein [Gammaproteobacteria bacterium]